MGKKTQQEIRLKLKKEINVQLEKGAVPEATKHLIAFLFNELGIPQSEYKLKGYELPLRSEDREKIFSNIYQFFNETLLNDTLKEKGTTFFLETVKQFLYTLEPQIMPPLDTFIRSIHGALRRLSVEIEIAPDKAQTLKDLKEIPFIASPLKPHPYAMTAKHQAPVIFSNALLSPCSIKTEEATSPTSPALFSPFSPTTENPHYDYSPNATIIPEDLKLDSHDSALDLTRTLPGSIVVTHHASPLARYPCVRL